MSWVVAKLYTKMSLQQFCMQKTFCRWRLSGHAAPKRHSLPVSYRRFSNCFSFVITFFRYMRIVGIVRLGEGGMGATQRAEIFGCYLVTFVLRLALWCCIYKNVLDFVHFLRFTFRGFPCFLFFYSRFVFCLFFSIKFIFILFTFLNCWHFWRLECRWRSRLFHGTHYASKWVYVDPLFFSTLLPFFYGIGNALLAYPRQSMKHQKCLEILSFWIFFISLLFQANHAFLKTPLALCVWCWSTNWIHPRGRCPGWCIPELLGRCIPLRSAMRSLATASWWPSTEEVCERAFEHSFFFMRNVSIFFLEMCMELLISMLNRCHFFFKMYEYMPSCSR